MTYPEHTDAERDDPDLGPGFGREVGDGSTQGPAVSTFDLPPRVASADDRPGVHYEIDGKQELRVVHQVRPGTTPVEGPTDAPTGAPYPTGPEDVRVTPDSASVHEARRRDDPGAGR